MRCSCCNVNLSDYESTLRHPETLEFLDTCRKCLEDIPISPLEGRSSENTDYYDEEEQFDFIDMEMGDDDV